MSTLEQLVDRVDTLLHGFTMNTESTTWLTAAVTNATTTTFVLADASVVSRGFLQIDEEIVYVASISNADNTITLAPWGRGQRGTNATTHTNLSKVTVAPLYPRYEIKKAINNTIDAMYPQVFGVGAYSFPYVAAKTTYSLPVAAEQILSVSHSVIGPSKEWLPVRAWQIDRTANPIAFGDGTAFGHSLSVYSPIVPGRTVNVAYAKRPTLFDISTTASTSQDFATTTGMPSYAEDVVLYGAAFRMVSMIDPSRMGPLSAEADLIDNQRGAKAGENSARFLFNVYQTRLGEVADNLRRQFPIRSHYQR
jgi:hypothetical protein